MQVNLDVDVYADLQPTGIYRSLYIGNACEPCFHHVDTWEEIVERQIGYHVVPVLNTIRNDDADELLEIAEGLEKAATLLRNRVEEMRDDK